MKIMALAVFLGIIFSAGEMYGDFTYSARHAKMVTITCVYEGSGRWESCKKGL